MEDTGVLYDSGTHGEGGICQSAALFLADRMEKLIFK